MSPLSWILDIYNLDNLDTRFTNPSTVPYKTVVDARDDPVATKEIQDKIRARSEPSKWKTPEYLAYGALLGVIIPYMFWIAIDASSRMPPPLPSLPPSHTLAIEPY